MLMGSVEVGFQCSKSTMDLVKKKGEKERDVRLGLKFKRGMGGKGGEGENFTVFWSLDPRGCF